MWLISDISFELLERNFILKKFLKKFSRFAARYVREICILSAVRVRQTRVSRNGFPRAITVETQTNRSYRSSVKFASVAIFRRKKTIFLLQEDRKVALSPHLVPLLDRFNERDDRPRANPAGFLGRSRWYWNFGNLHSKEIHRSETVVSVPSSSVVDASFVHVTFRLIKRTSWTTRFRLSFVLQLEEFSNETRNFRLLVSSFSSFPSYVIFIFLMVYRLIKLRFIGFSWISSFGFVLFKLNVQ